MSKASNKQDSNFGLALVVISFALAILAAIALMAMNYHECREMGFSRTYCATTHLIR